MFSLSIARVAMILQGVRHSCALEREGVDSRLTSAPHYPFVWDSLRLAPISPRFSHRERLLSSLPVSLISAVDCCCFRKLTSTGIEIVGVLGRARLQVSRCKVLCDLFLAAIAHISRSRVTASFQQSYISQLPKGEQTAKLLRIRSSQ